MNEKAIENWPFTITPFKLGILGRSNTGKTSLILQCLDEFEKQSEVSINKIFLYYRENQPLYQKILVKYGASRVIMQRGLPNEFEIEASPSKGSQNFCIIDDLFGTDEHVTNEQRAALNSLFLVKLHHMFVNCCFTLHTLVLGNRFLTNLLLQTDFFCLTKGFRELVPFQRLLLPGYRGYIVESAHKAFSEYQSTYLWIDLSTSTDTSLACRIGIFSREREKIVFEFLG